MLCKNNQYEPDVFVAQTLLIVRGLDACKYLKLQEFARIIFVDDIYNHSKKLEDQKPLKERPDYESQDFPKIVCGRSFRIDQNTLLSLFIFNSRR